MQHFQCITLYYFKKGKNATEMQKICAVYGEGAVTDQTCQKWFAKFLGTSDFGQTIHCWGCLVHWKLFSSAPGLHTRSQVADSWYTQNIQINKVIGENEKRVFYFIEKNIMDFLANTIFSEAPLNHFGKNGRLNTCTHANFLLK